jgi:hypothetical protein
MILGVTYMDVTKQKTTSKQLLTERFTGTWASYRLNKMFFDIDYTGNLYGPIATTRSFRPTKNIRLLGAFRISNSLLISSKLRIVHAGKKL